MNNIQLAEIALMAGEILLTSGAEIYRVEETIDKICACYQAKSESFVLPTGMFISIKRPDYEPVTSFKRIKLRSFKLDYIDAINSFSRSLEREPLSYEQAIEKLNTIKNRKSYGMPLRVLIAGVFAFVFALLFEGSLADGSAAFFIGMIIYIVNQILIKKGFFQFFDLFVAGLAAGALAVFSTLLFPQLNVYKIILGAIMLFLPGVAITNSIRDILYGDIIASISKLAEALFSVTALGVGVGIVLTMAIYWGLTL